MSLANALRGTRMGRKVEDPAAVIAQIENENARGKEEISIEPAIENRFPSLVPSVNGGIFQFDRLERLANGWSLVDLEVPEGHWKKITLFDKLIVGDAAVFPETLYAISDGTRGFKNGQLETYDQLVPRPDHIITAKAMYWFMRAACSSPSENCRSLRAYLRDVDRNHILSEVLHYGLGYRLNGDPYWSGIRVKSRGWPEKHPLIQDCIDFPTRDTTSYELHAETPCKNLIFSLLGDEDMDRVAWVFKHTYLLEGQVRLDLRNLGLGAGASPVTFRIKNIDGPGEPYNCIDSAIGERMTNAMTIRADASDFTPRVGK